MSRNKEGKGSSRGPENARSDEKVVSHAINHEYRLDALSIFYERVASPSEIQEALGSSLATASHHVKELYKDDVIELVKTEPRRGAVEHFYKAKAVPEIDAAEWMKLPKAARRGIAKVAMQAVATDGLASLRHGKLEIDDHMYIAWLPMKLSELGQGEVTEFQAEILRRFKEIVAVDEARCAEGKGEPGPTRIAATLWFERAQPGRPPRRKQAGGKE